MSSFIAQIMEPGGGVMLLPFVRMIIGCLMGLTILAAIFDVARIHMVILSILSGGLLLSLQFFEQEFQKVQAARNSNNISKANQQQQQQSGKTD